MSHEEKIEVLRDLERTKKEIKKAMEKLAKSLSDLDAFAMSVRGQMKLKLIR